jgi:Transposase and inactivated derivatives
LKRLNLSPTGYYNYLNNRKAEYHLHKGKVLNEIKRIYHETGGILGHRSMRVFLSRIGIMLSKRTVHKYMNTELGLISISRRNRPRYKKSQPHERFPNLLNQNFTVLAKNRVWCSDFTYIKLTNGLFRYNCSIIDLFDRSAIATVTGKWITSDLAIKTLKKAILSQGINPSTLIFHTDQGVQYTSLDFTSFCKAHKITQSMNRAGCPCDNAPMERFFNTLKTELINRYHFRTDEELSTAINEFVYVWYNQVRPHSYNKYLTPMEARTN